MIREAISKTTVWSFPKRGAWATHNSKYPGNWAPQIPHDVILMYSKEGEVVLDPMVGGGTTMIETKLLGRKGIAFDIHPEVVKLAKEACKFELDKEFIAPEINRGDARKMASIADESADLIATHPPYLNIIKYGERNVEGDLSAISNLMRGLYIDYSPTPGKRRGFGAMILLENIA